MMKEKALKKLPDAEFEVMAALWQAEPPVPRSYFDAQLRESRNWADSTILSLLSRLEEKGFLRVEKQGNRNVYTPVVGREEYLAFENRSFLSRLHGGSVTHLVAGMAQGGALKDSDIDALQTLLNSLKGGGKP